MEKFESGNLGMTSGAKVFGTEKIFLSFLSILVFPFASFHLLSKSLQDMTATDHRW